MTMNEFELIKQFFTNQKISRADVIEGIGDDSAIVTIPANKQLSITTDTLVAGVHFPLDTSAYDIGYKALAVNLSDLAAMGATPAWITLALTLPDANEIWLQEFCRGLFDLASRYNVELIGGDLTRGPLTITIQAHGFVSMNAAIKRSTAKPGDLIFVTHTLGDAAFGLRCLQKQSSQHVKYFLSRLNRPEPRIEMGLQLAGIATAAIDISDGLAADLGHILEKSRVGAVVYVDKLPLSVALRESTTLNECYLLALNGGDDYELCFTLPKEKRDLLKNDITCVGEITENIGLDLRFGNGSPYNEPVNGYRHF